MRPLEIRRLGITPYGRALEIQEELVEARRCGRVSDVLLLLEHPHVITRGANARRRPENILASSETLAARGVSLFDTGRGGDVTYHGPGQLVCYPIVDLRPDRCDVHRYVRDLEEVLIRTAEVFGLRVGRVRGLTGVWSGSDKVGAIGVRISRWITSHGFALNVSTDLDYFNLIIPCGLTSYSVTSFDKLMGRSLAIDSVETAVIEEFAEVFNRQIA